MVSDGKLIWVQCHSTIMALHRLPLPTACIHRTGCLYFQETRSLQQSLFQCRTPRNILASTYHLHLGRYRSLTGLDHKHFPAPLPSREYELFPANQHEAYQPNASHSSVYPNGELAVDDRNNRCHSGFQKCP